MLFCEIWGIVISPDAAPASVATTGTLVEAVLGSGDLRINAAWNLPHSSKIMVNYSGLSGSIRVCR